jgi:hypothetical protein
VLIGRGKARLAAAGQTTGTVRLTLKAKRRLARARRIATRLRLAATDASGQHTTITRRVTLTRTRARMT